ncbi:MAG: DUF6273 domain-containing protein, partial [Synergistaceae bacterium]|nr:DUF6273 domain-containing protein [Synergistaceae bacterium]
MTKKEERFFWRALVVLVAVLMFSAPAGAVPGDAKDLRGGYWTKERRWIAFGRYNGEPLIWRILIMDKTDRGTPCVLLLAERAVKKMEFGRDNDWNTSYIEKWINDDFYYAAFSEKEQNALVRYTHFYGGKFEGSEEEEATAASKVFLLSVEEAKDERYFADDADRNIESGWWLRSPGNRDNRAVCVNAGGDVSPSTLVFYSYGVRPALFVNLSSSIFTSSSSRYEILYSVRVKVRDAETYLIRDAAVEADSPKQNEATGSNG